MYLLLKRLLSKRSTSRASDKPPPVRIVDTMGRELRLVPLAPDLYELTHVPVDLQRQLNKCIALRLSNPTSAPLRERLGIRPTTKVYPHQVNQIRSIIYTAQPKKGSSLTTASRLQIGYAIRTSETEYKRYRLPTGTEVVINHVLPSPRRT